MSLVVLGVVAALAAALIAHRFDHDLQRAATRAAAHSTVVRTPCGAIEYQQAGSGVPLLVVHGSGGGHDQGMAVGGALVPHGVRVIAVSRFGYLRTPMPAVATPAAQADAHACLLDALGIAHAAVLGGSAGAPSAMQLAIRHPDRVRALVLLVPLAHKPAALADSAAPLAPWAERLMLKVIGSDFLFWAALQLARDTLIETVLATPPARLAAASPPERARVHALLETILPVSARAAGLRSDSVLGRSLGPYALASIRVPTLVISARDDGYRTFASAQYTAGEIAGATFIGFDDGGHVLVGHDDAVRTAILRHVTSAAAWP